MKPKTFSYIHRGYDDYERIRDFTFYHTYEKIGNKIMVYSQAYKNHRYEIAQGQSVEEELISNAGSLFRLSIVGWSNQLHHIVNVDEMIYVASIANINVKYATKEEKDHMKEYKELIKSETDKLRKFLSNHGAIIISDLENSNEDNLYALEINYSGTYFRIYIDINKDHSSIQYQVIPSNSPITGAFRHCKKLATLLNQLQRYQRPYVSDKAIIRKAFPGIIPE